MRLATHSFEHRDYVWPALPYKGLNYYDLSDVAIFDGREDDIERCARLILLLRTRLLFLHGSTGCGKSSFVRAGLIPFLENRDLGYSFIREDDSEMTSHFVRSTDDPLCRLGEVLFQLVGTKRALRTPTGLTIVDLSSCVRQQALALPQFVRQSPSEFVHVLSCLADNTPETLVLIFDQIEEVLTLRPDHAGDEARVRFFQFLELFIDAEIDIKIILSLRTEYLGRTLDHLDQSVPDTGKINFYLLKDVSEQDLIRAIVRPTSEQPYGNHGSPRQRYKFRFAPGVPQRIARDLKSTLPAGGILPAMQLVCGRLYQTARGTDNDPADNRVAEITTSHYRELGGMEGQINGHLSDALGRLCGSVSMPPREAILEIRRWRRALLSLVRVQIDGTVTTEVRPVSLFVQDAMTAGCKVASKYAILYLARDENLILREVKVYNAAQKKEIACVALGHDAIGLALTKYQIDESGFRLSSNIRLLSRFFVVGLVIAILVFNAIYFLASYVDVAFLTSQLAKTINAAAAAYLGMSALIAILPTHVYAILFKAAGRLYGALGFRSSSERLAVIADDLRRTPSAAAGDAREDVPEIRRRKISSKSRARREPSREVRRPYIPPFIDRLVKDRPWMGDVCVGLLMIASGTLKLLASSLPSTLLFASSLKVSLRSSTEYVDALASRLRNRKSQRSG